MGYRRQPLARLAADYNTFVAGTGTSNSNYGQSISTLRNLARANQVDS
jgi:hypothetical protein